MHQLIYTSAATHCICPQELESLVRRARRNNSRSSVTGLLAYHDRTFLHALEGDATVVRTLYQRIRLDPRHSDATILSQIESARRSFAGWDMALLNADSHPLWELPGFGDLFGDLSGISEMVAYPELAIKFLTELRDNALWRETVETGRSAVMTT